MNSSNNNLNSLKISRKSNLKETLKQTIRNIKLINKGKVSHDIILKDF